MYPELLDEEHKLPAALHVGEGGWSDEGEGEEGEREEVAESRHSP